MKIINDYIETLSILGLNSGFIPVTQEEWDDLMEGESYEGPVTKKYGKITVTIELIED